MTTSFTHDVGPVDTAVLVFDGDSLSAEFAPQLLELHHSGDVRVLDISFVSKAADGAISILEIEEADVAEAFAEIIRIEIDLLSDEDLALVAQELAPGTSALVLVWENTWPQRLAKAARPLGGSLVSLSRIDHDTVVRAIDGLEEQD